MSTEPYLTLEEAARLAPVPRAPHTVWRWAAQGVRRNGRCIRLEHRRIGRQLVTTHSWLEEFWRAVAQLRLEPRQVRHPNRLAQQVNQLLPHDLADAELREAGL